MPRGTTKRRPITIAALLDAALELFAEQGYGATSVPDICRRAGLTKGAFYSNFPNKDALFLALLDRSWQQRSAWIRRAVPASDVLATGTSDVSRVQTHPGVDRQWTLVSMEFSLHAIRQPAVAKLLVEHERRVRSELAALVAEGLARAARRPTVPEDELARMVVAVIEGTDIQELTNEAGGVGGDPEVGPRAVTALLRQFSVPDEATASGGARTAR
jgi:AcrR family transcriptional regulator